MAHVFCSIATPRSSHHTAVTSLHCDGKMSKSGRRSVFIFFPLLLLLLMPLPKNFIKYSPNRKIKREFFSLLIRFHVIQHLNLREMTGRLGIFFRQNGTISRKKREQKKTQKNWCRWLQPGESCRAIYLQHIRAPHKNAISHLINNKYNDDSNVEQEENRALKNMKIDCLFFEAKNHQHFRIPYPRHRYAE